MREKMTDKQRIAKLRDQLEFTNRRLSEAHVLLREEREKCRKLELQMLKDRGEHLERQNTTLRELAEARKAAR